MHHELVRLTELKICSVCACVFMIAGCSNAAESVSIAEPKVLILQADYGESYPFDAVEFTLICNESSEAQFLVDGVKYSGSPVSLARDGIPYVFDAFSASEAYDPANVESENTSYVATVSAATATTDVGKFAVFVTEKCAEVGVPSFVR